jgi:RimJ/RimL family protein N-acetyltransferase
MLRIETKRLILREYCHDDWQQIHEYCRDPQVTQFMIWGPNTEEQTKDFIARVIAEQGDEPRKAFELAVQLKETGRVIGGIGLRITDDELTTAALGYCYNRSAWGKGYGTEAVAAMLRFGFETLKLHRMWATCDPENIGSAVCMRKNGMVQEAHFRKDQRVKGVWRDTLVHAILEEEWRQLANRIEANIQAV